MTELLFKVADLILCGLLQKRRERKALSQKLEALKRNVIYENVANMLPVHLAKLRAFLIDSGLVQKPRFEKFLARWLSNPFLPQGRPMLGLFSNDEIAALKRELSCLRL
jgi:hypothetical protein